MDKGSLSPHVYDMDPNTIVEGKQSDTKWRYISAICMYTLLQIDYKNAHVSVNLSDNKFDAPKLSSDVIYSSHSLDTREYQAHPNPSQRFLRQLHPVQKTKM